MSMQKKRRIFAFDRYANYIYIVFTNGREPTGVSDAEPNSETTKAQTGMSRLFLLDFLQFVEFGQQC